MALSAAEQQELSQLEGDVGHAAPSSSLSHDEQAELSGLEKEVGHVASSGSKSSKNDSWLDTPVFGGTPRGYAHSALESLPFAGTLAGGVAGSAAGPIGAVGGAGLGAAAGESLKNMGESILGEPKSRKDIYLGPVDAAMGGAGAEAGGQVLGKGLEWAANTKAGKAAIDKTGKVAAKIASTFSGVPEKEISTYAQNAPKINQMVADTAGDHQELADQVRGSINKTIQDYRGKLNDQISSALKSSSKEKTIDVTPIIDHLETQKSALDPSLHPEAIKDIDNIVSRIKGTSFQPKESVLGYDAANELNARIKGVPYDQRITELSSGDVPDRLKNKMSPVPVISNGAKPGEAAFPEWTTDKSGKWVQSVPEDRIVEIPTGGGGTQYLANAQKLHQINKFLQDQASPAYGQSAVGFQVGDAASRAAKGAASVGRNILGDVVPEVNSANAGLSRLHGIEDVMNRNMLTEGKPAASLYAAGSEGNAAGSKVLKQLSQEAGSDISGQASQLAAARRFGDASFMPADHTGKSFTRMGAAGLIGGAAGYEQHGTEGAFMGALIGSGLASPAMVKLAIDKGMTGKEIAQAIMQKTPALTGQIINAFKSSGGDASELAQPTEPNQPPDLTPAKALPTKGPEKWANDGLQKLIDHSGDASLSDKRSSMLEDRKTRDLLIAASDLNPGSKAMERIHKQIKSQDEDKK